MFNDDESPENAQDETQPYKAPDEAVFVAYQEPGPMMAQHIEQIVATTQTMNPVAPAEVPPESAQEAADRAEYEEWKLNRHRGTEPEKDETPEDTPSSTTSRSPKRPGRS